MLSHRGTKTLTTPRLVLRRFALDDAAAMHRNWAGDAEVTKFLTWPTHPNADVSRTMIESWVPHYAEENYYHWTITIDGEAIGSIAVMHMNELIGSAEVGYCLGRNWWRQGLMTEALTAVIRFLMDEAGVERVEAYHDPRNPSSGAVMRKCGMQYEGTHRRSDRNNQGLCDAAWYAILKSDLN